MNLHPLMNRPDAKKHRCAMTGCPIWIQPNLTFCMKHWQLLPKSMQTEVWKFFRKDWRAWRRDHRKGISRDQKFYQSKDFVFAVQDAVDFLAKLEMQTAVEE